MCNGDIQYQKCVTFGISKMFNFESAFRAEGSFLMATGRSLLLSKIPIRRKPRLFAIAKRVLMSREKYVLCTVQGRDRSALFHKERGRNNFPK
jgi:hypothetical protein